VDRDGSGECEYPEFVEIMTLSLDRIREEQQRSGEKQGPDISFDIMATAYRRKRLMEGLMSSDRDAQNQILHMAANQLNEVEALKTAAAKRAGGSGGVVCGGGQKGEQRGHRHVRGGEGAWQDLLEGLGAEEKSAVLKLAMQPNNVPNGTVVDMQDLAALARCGLVAGRAIRKPPPEDMLHAVRPIDTLRQCFPTKASPTDSAARDAIQGITARKQASLTRNTHVSLLQRYKHAQTVQRVASCREYRKHDEARIHSEHTRMLCCNACTALG
jgi:hypothetical protein